MSNVPIEIIEDLTALLKQFKSKNEESKELALKQLTTYLNNNREYTDEIIEEMSKFFDSQNESIEETDFYKIINNICSILEKNYLSTTKFINKIFPMLMQRIYYFSQNGPKDDFLLFNIIAQGVGYAACYDAVDTSYEGACSRLDAQSRQVLYEQLC
jgi:hypothetical protein